MTLRDEIDEVPVNRKFAQDGFGLPGIAAQMTRKCGAMAVPGEFTA
jgi:hypothetical protein